MASSSSWTNNASGAWASQTSHPSCERRIGRNVSWLVAWREISPRVKRPLKRLWDEAATCGSRYGWVDAKLSLIAWLEEESLKHYSAKYCPLVPPPRSTIAAAFSPDGSILASTHGDHTVKIICYETGTCLKVLSGHRRTPWVVRFHPFHQGILASGSLDHEVRLWDANTAQSLGSRDFNRPIASIAFHAQGDLLAVASGHRLYIWRYNEMGDTSAPISILRTRRSLRAVHFHPHASPILLTAEVNDLDAADSSMAVASSQYLPYLPGSGIPISSASSEYLMPFIQFLLPDAMANRNNVRDSQPEGLLVASNTRESEAKNTETLESVRALDLEKNAATDAPVDVHAQVSNAESLPESVNPGHIPESEPESNVYESGVDMLLRAAEEHLRDCQRNHVSLAGEVEDLELSNHPETSGRMEPGCDNLVESSISGLPERQQGQIIAANPDTWTSSIPQRMDVQLFFGGRQMHQFLPFGDQPGWELPFLQGLMMGHTQAGLHPNLPITESLPAIQLMPSDARISDLHQLQQNRAVSLARAALAPGMATTILDRRSTGRHPIQAQVSSQGGTGFGLRNGTESGQAIFDIPEVAATQATFAVTAALTAAELPCTVKLRVWPFDVKNPCALLDSKRCRLTIPHAVLCSEMGAHFSPCGRFLAACVACVLPSPESEVGMQSRSNFGVGSTTSSPTRHPISTQRVVYELRIYSFEEATFGEVLASRAIRAAHCLTSIQFSPTSSHILLAYGRRHNSLMRSVLGDGTVAMPVYTILEVYRVSDMKLVGVLPSTEDEVNVACFHPLVGGGLAYGTKEGKLRIISMSSLNEENVFEVV